MTLFFACVLCSAQEGEPFPLPPLEREDARTHVSQWQPIIAEAARRFAIPEDWIRSVMAAESGGRVRLNGRPVVSRARARGLMQVMPGTYGELRRRYDLGADSYEPQNNIFAGAAYLREMYERYGYPLLFAAYNAGPRRLDDYLLRGMPLPGETKAYLAGILPGIANVMFEDGHRADAAQQTSMPESSRADSPTLFFVLSAPVSAAPSSTKLSQLTSKAHSLFVPRDASVAAVTGVQNSELFVPLSADSTKADRK